MSSGPAAWHDALDDWARLDEAVKNRSEPTETLLDIWKRCKWAVDETSAMLMLKRISEDSYQAELENQKTTQRGQTIVEAVRALQRLSEEDQDKALQLARKA